MSDKILRRAKPDSRPRKCLNPNCKRKPVARGLCASCYTRVREVIVNKKMTEERLIKEGKLMPSLRVRTDANAKKWLIGTKSRHKEAA